MTPVASADLDVGPAAYYSASFDNGGWDAIIAKRIAWGQIDPDTFAYSPDGYYCVSPDHDLGDRLAVFNAITGAGVVCTVADVVAPRDVSHWRASVVIEVSWAAFVAADGRTHNRFVVMDAERIAA